LRAGEDPGFALEAVLTLARGNGLNSARFRAVNPVLLRPFPFFEPDQLVYPQETSSK